VGGIAIGIHAYCYSWSFVQRNSTTSTGNPVDFQYWCRGNSGVLPPKAEAKLAALRRLAINPGWRHNTKQAALRLVRKFEREGFLEVL